MEPEIALSDMIWLNVAFVAVMFGLAGLSRLLDWLGRKGPTR